MKPLHSLLASLFLASAALATLPAQAREANAMASACRSDYQTFCSKVKPGGGQVAQCLQEHAAELSAPCKAQLGTVKQCTEQIKAVCGTDGTDKAALRTCLKAHASELGAACRTL